MKMTAVVTAAGAIALAAAAWASTTRGFQGSVTAIDHKTRTLTWKSLPDPTSPAKSLTATWDDATRFEQQASDSFDRSPAKPAQVTAGAKVYAEAVDADDSGAWRLKTVRLLP